MAEQLPPLPEVPIPHGVFWADHIKTLKNQPRSRLSLALKYRPLPAAFNHAAIALRAMIREQHRQKASTDDFLNILYRVHAQADFLLSTPYIDGIGPGFNVAESMPRKEWRDLNFPYEKVGYQQIVINKTDIKWFVEAWGEPRHHCATRDLYGDLWNRAVSECRRKIQQRDEQFRRDIRDLLGS